MVLLILMLVSNSFGQSTQPTQPTTAPVALKEFVSDGNHFRLKYPVDWAPPDQIVLGYELVLQSPPDSTGTSAVVRLKVVPTPPVSNERAHLADLSGAVAGYAFENGGKKVTIKDAHLGLLRARSIKFI